MPSSDPGAPKRFVSPQEFAAELGISVSSFYAHLRRSLPSVTVGRRICFDLDRCLAILEAPKEQPAAPPPPPMPVYTPPPRSEARDRELREKHPKLWRALEKLRVSGDTPPPEKPKSPADLKWERRLAKLQASDSAPKATAPSKLRRRLDNW